MRLRLTGLCLVGLLLASPAMAGPIGIELTSGQTSNPVNLSQGALLSLFGDAFVLTAGLAGSGGAFSPSSPYITGSQIAIRARWTGLDAQGSLTYQGQTFHFGGFDDPGGLDVNFLSNPFTVPSLDNPVVLVPFSLTATVSRTPTINDTLNLHGTGTMAFTFSGPNPNIRPENQPGWFGGAALFTIEPSPIEQTPEPSVLLSLGAALSGLVAYTRRRAV